MLQLTINRTSWREYMAALEAREPFKTYGNLRGFDYCVPVTGYLPEPHRAEYNERREFIDYTVVSYGTPVAWHDTERGWKMPDVRYSPTTSKAQGRIRPAINVLNAA